MRCNDCDFDPRGPVPAVPGDLCPRCGELLTPTEPDETDPAYDGGSWKV